jgi:hypothetical protein
VDAPETAKGESADNYGSYVIMDKKGEYAEGQSGHEPYPPALFPPAVFHFDDQGMADAYAQEYGGAYDNSVKIHTCVFNLQSSLLKAG